MYRLIRKGATYRTLAGMLRAAGGGTVTAEGLWGAAATMLTASLADDLACPVLYVTAHLDEADEARDELELFAPPGCTIDLLPAWPAAGGLPSEVDATDEIYAERLRIVTRLIENAAPAPNILVAPISALMQPAPTREAMAANSWVLRLKGSVDLEELARWLIARGFSREEVVETVGQFSIRGGVVDVFCPTDRRPLRIELFGDEIESLRHFDPDTQRSEEQLEAVTIRAAARVETGAAFDPASTTTLTTHLPADTLVVLRDPAEIAEIGRAFIDRLDSPVGIFPLAAALRHLGGFRACHMQTFSGQTTGPSYDFRTTTVTRFEGDVEHVRTELEELAKDNEIYVFCDNVAEAERFREVAAESPTLVNGDVQTPIGLLHHGFNMTAEHLIVLGHHEVFHRYGIRRRVRKPTARGRPLDTFLDLQTGDYVVHAAHGIGRFVGLQAMDRDGKRQEFLAIEFADRAKVYVPASHIELVQKYVGGIHGARPKLNKLGGSAWSKTKAKAAEAVEDLAADLLETQAQRESLPGVAYPADTKWQKEFEASFIYDETDDQLAAMDDIKRDMLSHQPMDRLLCGDVGYGKTELAIRAAFKTVEHGRQVAVVVPTTVLAEQHGRTFAERLADYPFRVDVVSRFKTAKEQRLTLEALRRGQIDVIIGTHRLFSADVGFKDLGLLVIDEEQRFGVKHKEALKKMRATVEILTMTATPIPRTLQMSLLGMRDISSLNTPPADRRAIHTDVCRFDRKRIRDAIVRELNRDGQVYYVHNRVYNIRTVASTIRQIVPEARVIFGHGQMHEHELEEIMLKFVRHEADVLVSTTIIESGLDIPNVNTIFIQDADRFGLADLHQLRGRVGRYKYRAYCYLLLPEDRSITPKAAKRLKAIEEYSELGAGFRIAMRDLEIRGAGNILGPEQSGHIAAIGYEMYCRMLEASIRRMKKLPAEERIDVEVDVGLDALLSRHYVPSDRQRMGVYRELAQCRTMKEVHKTAERVRDMYGEMPQPAEWLFDLAELRVAAHGWRIKAVVAQSPDLIFSVKELSLLGPLFAGSPGNVRVVDPQTVHLRLTKTYFEPQTLLAVLRKLLIRKDAPPPESPRIASVGRSKETAPPPGQS